MEEEIYDERIYNENEYSRESRGRIYTGVIGWQYVVTKNGEAIDECESLSEVKAKYPEAKRKRAPAGAIERRQRRGPHGDLLWRLTTNYDRVYIAAGDSAEQIMATAADPACNTTPEGEEEDSPIEIALAIEPLFE